MVIMAPWCWLQHTSNSSLFEMDFPLKIFRILTTNQISNILHNIFIFLETIVKNIHNQSFKYS